MDWKELAGPARLDQMKTAVQMLSQWQKSVYFMPLLENPVAYEAEKERIAAALVDSHLGKLAKRIRMLPGNPGTDEEAFLDQWAEITFMTRLWSRFDSLPEGQKLNLIYQSGPNITQRHLDNETPYLGRFHVVATDLSTEENLQRRSVYILDIEQGRIFVMIDYSFHRRPFERPYHIGETYEGAVVLYPIPVNLRIRVKEWKPVSHPQRNALGKVTMTGVEQMAELFTGELKQNPFVRPYPVVLLIRSLYDENKGWKVVDQTGRILRLDAIAEEQQWTFYSAIFSELVSVMGLWDAGGFSARSYYNGEVFVPLGMDGADFGFGIDD